MGKVCIRCGYERKDTDTAPLGECPACGVIYARVEDEQRASTQASQARILRSSMRRQQKDTAGSAAFLMFNWMLSPWLVRGSFILLLIASGVAIVSGALRGNAMVVAGAFFILLFSRMVLESIIVLFRIAEDLGAIREQLADDAVETARWRDSETKRRLADRGNT